MAMIVRLDNSGISKKRGVCCYFKENLPIRIMKITSMTKCLALEMPYNNKLVIVCVIFPSLTSLSFLELILIHGSF